VLTFKLHMIVNVKNT